MNAVKERPILFSGSMVAALLAGRKTQTRRIVKANYEAVSTAFNTPLFEPQSGNWYLMRDVAMDRMGVCLGPCPYGVVGQRLWVRETWNALYNWDGGEMPYYHHEMDKETRDEMTPDQFIYRVCDPENAPTKDDVEAGFKWQPSIFMPRAASRILLEVTEVRLQRLGSITYPDAQAEGIQVIETDRIGDIYGLPGRTDLNTRTSLGSFGRLWASIHGQESWGENPWVWAVSFIRVPA